MGVSSTAQGLSVCPCPAEPGSRILWDAGHPSLRLCCEAPSRDSRSRLGKFLSPRQAWEPGLVRQSLSSTCLSPLGVGLGLGWPIQIPLRWGSTVPGRGDPKGWWATCGSTLPLPVLGPTARRRSLGECVIGVASPATWGLADSASLLDGQPSSSQLRQGRPLTRLLPSLPDGPR